MTDEQISRLLARRNKLTNRRDGRINRPALNEIDAQLATVPAGQRNDIDLLLGRPCAVLPVRDAIARAADEAGAEAQWLTPREVARLDNIEMTRIAADAMVEAWHERLAGLSAVEVAQLEARTAERSGIVEHYDSSTEGHW